MWPEHFKLEEPHVDEAISVIQAQQSVVDWSRINSYRKSIKNFEYCLRFITQQKAPITVEEMEKSQFLIFRLAQLDRFRTFANLLLRELPRGFRQSWDDCRRYDRRGTIHLRGRLRRSELSRDTKHPMLVSQAASGGIVFQAGICGQ